MTLTNQRSTTSSEWSFSFRTTNASFYSDSESDTDGVNSDETRLINDLDLSSREETVLYKPNPFSIAKINAASRAQSTIGASLEEPPKDKPILKAKATNQPIAKGNIIDGFKKQAEKSQSRSLSGSTLKPGLVASKRCAPEKHGGTQATRSTKATGRTLPSKNTGLQKSKPFKTLFQKSKVVSQSGASVQSSDTPIIAVPSASLAESRSPAMGPGSAPAEPLTHNTLLPAPRFSSGIAPCATASASLSVASNSQNIRHAHTATETQHTSSPDHQLVLPVVALQSQNSPASSLQQPESQLHLTEPSYDRHSHQLPANNLVPLPVSASNQNSNVVSDNISMPASALSSPQCSVHGPVSYVAVPNHTNTPTRTSVQSTLDFKSHKSKFRPQHGGPFSSPILRPVSGFLPPRFQDDNARAFPKPSVPDPVPFSSPLRPSDSYAHAFAAASVPPTFSDARAFPSRALNFASSSRARFFRNGLQPLHSRLRPPFTHSSQHQFQQPGSRQIMDMVVPQANDKQGDEYHVPFDNMNEQINNPHYDYMRTDPPNWNTPDNDTFTSLHHPSNNSWTEQNGQHLMHTNYIDADDDYQEREDKYTRAYQVSAASSRSAASTTLPTKTPMTDKARHQFSPSHSQLIEGNRKHGHAYKTSTQNNTKNYTQAPKKKKRERSPSLSGSISSPSPEPELSPACVRKRHRDSKFKDKPKSDIGNSKIRNINAYSFTGSNQHETQDEEWSTLKKAKTKTSVKGLPGVRTSAKLKLPMALLSKKRIGIDKDEQKTGMSATSARRVITFLPPPRRAKAVSHETEIEDKENVLSEPTDNVRDQNQVTLHKSTTDRYYPSPKRSAFSPRHSPDHRQLAEYSVSKPVPIPGPRSRSRLQGRDYRPPSPPASDPVAPLGHVIASEENTVQEHEVEDAQDNVRNEDRGQDQDSDATVQIDITSIARRYPAVNACMREYRRQEGQVWTDVLGLPSCGRVYRDVEAEAGAHRDGSSEVREMGIAVWTGAGD